MSVTAAAVQPEKRLYYLDWLRVLIIGGVFLAHAVLPFTGGDWLIVSGSLIPIAGAIAIIGNQFGMPLLFLISGAATVFSMRRRTNKQYARERFFRLIIPYIVLTLILSPLQAYYQALDHGWYSGSFIGYLPQFFNLNGVTGFNLQWAGRYGFHLWFLVFLFFYAIVTIPLFTYLAIGKRQTLVRIFRSVVSPPRRDRVGARRGDGRDHGHRLRVLPRLSELGRHRVLGSVLRLRLHPLFRSALAGTGAAQHESGRAVDCLVGRGVGRGGFAHLVEHRADFQSESSRPAAHRGHLDRDLFDPLSQQLGFYDFVPGVGHALPRFHQSGN